jgi:hypothetical protein
VETVRAEEYQYFYSDAMHDFGPVRTSGAVAVRCPSPGKVVFYEVLKGGGIQFRVGQLPGTASGDRLSRAWILLTRGRKVELKFPDITQEGDIIRFGPTEMATTVGYEIELHR